MLTDNNAYDKESNTFMMLTLVNKLHVDDGNWIS